MAPSRAAALVALARNFVAEFFDQNPLSQLAISVLRHGASHALTEMSASPEIHRRALSGAVESGGPVSLQNSLEQAAQARV